MFSTFFVNWKTTLAGVLVMIFTFAASNVGLYFDGDAATNPDFQSLFKDIVALAFGGGLLFARDSGVTDFQELGVEEPDSFTAARKR